MPLTAAWLLPLLLLSAAWQLPAAANPDPATETSADAAGSDLQAVLNMHNTFRSWHGAAPMTWDPELAQSAATFLTQCQFRMESGLTVGQNLGVTGAKDIGGQLEAVTQMWYDSGKQYDWSNPGFQMNSGQFTQLVWKATTKLGCAARFCPAIAGFGPGVLVSCRYSPPGNVYGGFPANVKPKGSKPADADSA